MGVPVSSITPWTLEGCTDPYFISGGQEAQKNNALNLGLYDQRDALTWVQNYISYFGGDPKKVTAFGMYDLFEYVSRLLTSTVY